jgi:hypothetical protein
MPLKTGSEGEEARHRWQFLVAAAEERRLPILPAPNFRNRCCQVFLVVTFSRQNEYKKLMVSGLTSR